MRAAPRASRPLAGAAHARGRVVAGAGCCVDGIVLTCS